MKPERQVRNPSWRLRVAAAGALGVVLFAAAGAFPALGSGAGPAAPRPATAAPGAPVTPPSAPACFLLDDAVARATMDALLWKLLVDCGRRDELGGPQAPAPPAEPGAPSGPAGPGVAGDPDAPVNDPSDDAGSSHTQSETSVAYDPVHRILCAGYNDSYHAVVEDDGFGGFSRSTDGGATWEDRGGLGAGSRGDPSLVWRRKDGRFYYFNVEALGLGVWRSADGCRTFQFLGRTHVGGGDDKQLAAVDNDPASPFYGRLYVGWKDFAAAGRIFLNHSDDGGETWTEPVAVSTPMTTVQGATPVVAPGGVVYVAWVHWNPFPTVIDIEIARSTDGGDTFTRRTNPATGRDAPLDEAATAACGRAALHGMIRYLPAPQLAVGGDGALHVVYAYDPDGPGASGSDAADAFYRRSTDGGATWGPEVRLNDDATATDQFFPSISVGEDGAVAAAWYDRRLDPGNLQFDYFRRVSLDGGVTWPPSVRVSDVSSPVYIDPELTSCYHGDYDQQVQTPGFAHLLWSDDRNLQGGHPDPDVWSEAAPAGTDFLLRPVADRVGVCAPADALFAIDLLQFQGFAEPVTLTAAGEPAGTTAVFVPNPAAPPSSIALTIAVTGGAAPGGYPIAVTGTSSPGGIVHPATVTLDIFDGPPGTASLLSPPDGTLGNPLSPVLSWTPAAQGAIYRVEVATDAGFADVVYGATTEATTQTVATLLAPRRRHFWRVRAANPCGEGPLSAVFSFVTKPVPPILLVDDDDDAPDARPYFVAALADLGLGYDVFDTGFTDHEPEPARLALYRTVLWFTGGGFGGFAGPGPDGEAALAGWLETGGRCLVLTAQDYRYDHGFTPFMAGYLGVVAVGNDTRHTVVTGEGVFAGLGPFVLGHPYVNFSDTLFPNAEGEVAFTGDQGTAAVRHPAAGYRTHFFGFPLEAIQTAAGRAAVLARALDDCAEITSAVFADGFESGDTSSWSATVR